MPTPIDTIGVIIITDTIINIIPITIDMAIIIVIIPISTNMATVTVIIPIIRKRFVMTIDHMSGTINILMDIGTLVRKKFRGHTITRSINVCPSNWM